MYIAQGQRQIHTCHTVLTEICEIWPIFKGDLIKFCEILTKMTLKPYQNGQKPLFKSMKLMVETTKGDILFISSLVVL